MLNWMFAAIGPGGTALLLGTLVLGTTLRVVFGRPQLQPTGFVLGLFLGICLIFATPVYTDSSAPPLALLFIPTGCILAAFTFLPTKSAILPSAAAAIFAVSLHRAWTGNVFRDYVSNPRRAATYAKEEMKRAEREFQMYTGALDPKTPMKAGFLDEPPYADDLSPRVFSLKRHSTAAEWHTPITGLYRDTSSPIRLWTKGGLPGEATIEAKAPVEPPSS